MAKLFHAAILVASAWLLGFIFFLAAIPSPAQNEKAVNQQADAIIVLTGGAERLKEGFRLLIEGKADILFITGVRPGISKEQLVSSLDDLSIPEPFLAKVELGHEAGNTIGNAEETGYWLAERGFSRIFLVTGSYHMNRALLEFNSFLRWVEIIPYAAYPTEMLDPYWWTKPKILWLLFYEYHKYLVASLRQVWLGVQSS